MTHESDRWKSNLGKNLEKKKKRIVWTKGR